MICGLEWWFDKSFTHIDGLVPDCSSSSAVAMELLQSCTKPPILYPPYPPLMDKILMIKKKAVLTGAKNLIFAASP